MTGAADVAVMIGLARVEQVYRGGRGVGFSGLRGVDVAISAAEMAAITGPSGSGKSTIIKLIAAAFAFAFAFAFAAIMTSFAAMSRHSA